MATEDVVIVPYRDGPYLVRGPLVLRDQDGQTIELSRRTVALCRCGKSRMRPFCDGTHRLVQFRAPSEAERPREEPPVPRPADAAEGRAHAGNGASDNGNGASHNGNGHAAASRNRGSTAALAGLRRAGRRVSSLLDAPSATRGQAAIRTALPLIDGAARLLEGSAQTRLAALHLVKGAFDALGDAADPREPGLAAAAAELAAVAVALEPVDNGSWRF
jgi:CDGSH-type Zn-finger protein